MDAQFMVTFDNNQPNLTVSEAKRRFIEWFNEEGAMAYEKWVRLNYDDEPQREPPTLEVDAADVWRLRGMGVKA